MKIRSAYKLATGKVLNMTDASSKASSHEIILGESNRKISKKAYRRLATVERERDDFSGFVIYSDGKSAAIAFDGAVFGENVALASAVEFFVKEYMSDSSLKFGRGVVCHEFFDPMAKQAERDEIEKEFLWDLKLAQITEKTGSDAIAEMIVSALKELYAIYNVDSATAKKSKILLTEIEFCDIIK